MSRELAVRIDDQSAERILFVRVAEDRQWRVLLTEVRRPDGRHRLWLQAIGRHPDVVRDRSAALPAQIVQFHAGCSGSRESSGLKSHDFSYLLPLHPKWNCSSVISRPLRRLIRCRCSLLKTGCIGDSATRSGIVIRNSLDEPEHPIVGYR